LVEDQIMSKSRGISLHIGVNHCHNKHYGKKWCSFLASCENDADTMQAIARTQGFETSQLKTVGATREAVIAAITSAAEELNAGDIFLVSYSGHGGQVKDVNDDEEDGRDDTWCLFNGQLLDDELDVLFSGFAQGVRVLVLSDSCHSGTMLKSGGEAQVQGEEQSEVEEEFVYARAMPRDAARATLAENRPMYDKIQNELPNPKPPITASLRLLSGCQEDELSYGSIETGRFTEAVKNVFADGDFEGDYSEFHQLVVEAVSKRKNPQTPGHAQRGETNPDFDRQSPFKI
jgi:hypothetical protein